MSTARIYFYDRKQHVNKRVITVCHGKDSIEDELTIIVDFGEEYWMLLLNIQYMVRLLLV